MKSIYIAVIAALAASAAAPAAFGQEKPNPFTGTTAAFEQRLRTLEERKIDAAIANEELAKEKSDQERLRLRTGGRTAPVAIADTAPAAPKSKPSVKIEPVEVAPPPPPKPKAPRLVGTVATAAGWVALVEKGATVINVPDRSTVDGVSVSQISQNGALLNGAYVELDGSAVAKVSAPPSVPTGLRAGAATAAPTVAQGPAIPTEALDLAGRR